MSYHTVKMLKVGQHQDELRVLGKIAEYLKDGNSVQALLLIAKRQDELLIEQQPRLVDYDPEHPYL